MPIKERKSPWVKKYKVLSDKDDKYVVSQKEDGTWGCSCPKWKFQRGRREDCHHISYVTQVLSLLESFRSAVLSANRGTGRYDSFMAWEADSSAELFRRAGQLTLVSREDWTLVPRLTPPGTVAWSAPPFLLVFGRGDDVPEVPWTASCFRV